MQEMERLNNIHTGEVLLKEFLDPMEISPYRLSKETFIPQSGISEIIKERESLPIQACV